MQPSLIDSLAATTAHRDRDDLNSAVATLLLGHLEAESIEIYRLIEDESTKRLARRVGLVRGGGVLKPDDLNSIAQLPALSNVAAWQECVTSHETVQYEAPNGHTRAVFPVESEREVIGLLELETSAPLGPRDAELVVGILRILRNHLALLDYGERDTLTGLLNRKTFEASFEKLRGRTGLPANADPSWLGVVDIDKFKSINDNYGHLFGDEVLLLLGRIMRESFRGADHLFRFGGEEFIIVLDRATEVGADVAFNRLRAAVEAFRFPQVGRVTISLGYTQVHANDAPATCVERADAALYYAKHQGRNRVFKYETLIAQGELHPKLKNDDIELF
jgi:diguanylate cyclase (GGDEF)-like protein